MRREEAVSLHYPRYPSLPNAVTADHNPLLLNSYAPHFAAVMLDLNYTVPVRPNSLLTRSHPIL